jgi:lambda family phage portal protein
LTSRTAGGDENGEGGETAPDGVEFGNLQSGTVLRMMRDEQLQFFNPPETGENYAAFTETQLRGVGQGVRSLPYENVSGDASKSNFSSHRARRLAFQRICEQIQYGFAFQVCRPMFNAWMDAAVLAGVFDFRGYDVNARPYRRVAWRMPKWDWLDPLNEAKAEVLLVDNLLKPRSMSIQERGYDEEDVDEQIEADQAREREKGLIRRSTSQPISPDAPTPAETARTNNQ